MYSATLILMILAGMPVIVVYFNVKQRRAQTLITPNRVSLVKTLISELDKANFWLERKNAKGEETLIELNLFEIAKLIEGKHVLSKEKFDDHQLIFADNLNQVIDFNAFLNNKLLPKVIHDELKHFENRRFNPVKVQGSGYFKIYFPKDNTYLNIEFNGAAYEGNAEAFESWSGLKESAHSLCFVIKQWMNEHSEDVSFEKKFAKKEFAFN